MKASHLLVAALAASLVPPAQAGLYRWVDEHGNITYSDQVPPEQAGSGHAELNRQGMQVREIGPAKTAEQRAREEAQEELRRAEQLRIEQQREADLILLRSFPTEDEIQMARDGKLATFDLNIDVLYGNARRMKQRLLDMSRQVAARNRGGKPAAASLEAEMASLKQHLTGTYRRILDDAEKKRAIRDEYAGYLRRYRELKGLPQATETAGDGEPGSRSDRVTAIACTGKSDCAARWERAVAYLKQNTGTPVAMATESLVISARPEDDAVIGLTLALVPDAGADSKWILLELQCNATAVGSETCENATAQAVRRGFNGAVSDDEPPAARTAPARMPPKPVPAG